MIVGHIGGGSVSAYSIDNSLRFRASNSASISYTTPASGGDRDKWWIYLPFKRGRLGVLQYMHGADTASADSVFFNAADQFCVTIAGTARLVSTRVFRDPTAWGAALVVYDASNGTAVQRLRVYERSETVSTFAEMTAWGTDARSGITAGTAKTMHNSIAHVIGKNPTAASDYFDGYLTQYRIGTWSGSQPTPANFGSVNTDGIWVDSGSSASYGTSGSFLKFNDGTSATTLCYDRSGNANNWTPSGISTTAGVTYDWMTDTPTNNYATLNPLSPTTSSAISQASLYCATPGAYWWNYRGSQYVTSGKLYFEGTCVSPSFTMIGVATPSASPTEAYAAPTESWTYLDGGTKYGNGSAGLSYGASFTANDVVGVALDLDAGTITFYKNNVSQGVAFSTGLTGKELTPWFGGYNAGRGWYANFGQRPFAYTPPTGFKSLCTANRPTGDSITTSGTFDGNLNADGPFVWLKGNPETMTINGNAVTWGTHADKTAGGFKVRTASSSYNNTGSNTYSVSVTGKLFGDIVRAPNTAKGNP
ncbi:MAG: hypothetical protein KJ787_13870 [Gammaproteobacteria bacterium]|nr:hypothetical protein [Gammaproteobacteria bacterium]MBU1647414.1 hypothetical protein [Gammaproteobacteria bacterium]MBU1973206.1 hypothetical protein [Gammaproteobacteria bacterium]